MNNVIENVSSIKTVKDTFFWRKDNKKLFISFNIDSINALCKQPHLHILIILSVYHAQVREHTYCEALLKNAFPKRFWECVEHFENSITKSLDTVYTVRYY